MTPKTTAWEFNHAEKVTRQQRSTLLQQRPVTLWLTGFSASGKSTLAYSLERQLIERGNACYVLDGDNVRRGLSADLGFSTIDRAENIRRVAEVARLMNDAGLIVIAALPCPATIKRRLKRFITLSCNTTSLVRYEAMASAVT